MLQIPSRHMHSLFLFQVLENLEYHFRQRYLEASQSMISRSQIISHLLQHLRQVTIPKYCQISNHGKRFPNHEGTEEHEQPFKANSSKFNIHRNSIYI